MFFMIDCSLSPSISKRSYAYFSFTVGTTGFSRTASARPRRRTASWPPTCAVRWRLLLARRMRSPRPRSAPCPTGAPSVTVRSAATRYPAGLASGLVVRPISRRYVVVVPSLSVSTSRHLPPISTIFPSILPKHIFPTSSWLVTIVIEYTSSHHASQEGFSCPLFNFHP